jgi:hypothetical protein
MPQMNQRRVVLPELPACDACVFMGRLRTGTRKARFDSLLSLPGQRPRWGYSCGPCHNLYGVGTATYIITPSEVPRG